MEQQATSNKLNPTMLLVGIIVIAVIGFVLFQGMKPTSNTTQKTTKQEVTVSPTAAEKKMASYKDGSYKATGNYTSPAGEEEIAVMITLANSIITDVTVEPKATNQISKAKQADFVANYKEMVMGKSIQDVKLGKVSGSSLTPQGFNEALEEIKTEAAS
jgi:uncharacterized protein with FMN-binding domain